MHVNFGPAFLVTVGSVAVLVGALDPMEGSFVFVANHRQPIELVLQQISAIIHVQFWLK